MGLDILSNIWNVAKSPVVTDLVAPGLLSIYAGNRKSGAVSNAGQQAIAGMQQGASTLREMSGKGLSALADQYAYGAGTLVPYSGFGMEGLAGYSDLMEDPSLIESTPGYDFRFNKGLEALNRSQAARRGLLSGSTMEGVQEYGQNFVMDEYDRALARRALQVETGLKGASTLADLSQAYGRGVAGIYEGLGEGLSGIYGDIGATGAATTLGTENARQGPLSDILNIWQRYQKGKEASSIGSVTTGLDQLATAGGGNPAAAIWGEGGLIDQYGAGTWGDLSTGPNAVSGLSSLYAAPGSVGEWAAFSDAPFGMLSEYGIGAEAGATGAASQTGALSGVTPMLKTLGIAGAVLGGVKLLDSIRWGKGGSSQSAKIPKFTQTLRNSLQSDPSGKSFENQVSNLVTNVLWRNEENRFVVQELLDNGAIPYDYAKLHSKDSIYNLWNVGPENIPKKYEYRERSGEPATDDFEPGGYYKTYGANDDDPRRYKYQQQEKERFAKMSPNMIKGVQGAYGLAKEQADKYAELVSLTNIGPTGDGWPGREIGRGEWQALAKEREAFEKTYLTEARKKATARNMLQRIRGRGYTGDLSKLEQYLAS